MIRINLLDEPGAKKVRGGKPPDSVRSVFGGRRALVSRASQTVGPNLPISHGDRRPSLRMLADIALSDEVADKLGFKAFADAIAGIIDSPRTVTPLVMAINAKWGAGKTTLGQMVRRRLEMKPAAGGYAPHVTCWFNSWMHDDAPNLATPLAADIAQAANRSRAIWRRFIMPLPSNLAAAKWRRVRKGLVYFAFLMLIVVACTVASLRLGFSLSEVVKLDPRVFTSLSNIPGTLYVGALLVALVLLLKGAVYILPVAKSVGEFVKDPESAARTASMFEVRRQLGKLIRQARPKASKFVIFIDDLDRCRPPRSVDVLEAVNQLLDHPGVVVVIMADMQVVAKCADIKYRSLERAVETGASMPAASEFSTFGWNYLQKIIQLQFDLPIYPVGMIRGMIEALVKEVPEEAMSGWLVRVWGRLLSDAREASAKLREAHAIRFAFALASALLVGSAAIAVVRYTRLRIDVVRATFLSAFQTSVVSFSVFVVGSRLAAVIVSNFRSASRRRAIDEEIQARLTAGERDFSKVEASIRRSNLTFGNRPDFDGLLRERLQRYLEDESELQREAENEVMRHLEPMPRHAKRLLNRLRLLLFVAHERKMFGGSPQLSPRHIGKWAVLCERWPEIAQVVYSQPSIMAKLENAKTHKRVIREVAGLYEGDADLSDFCLSGREVRLSPLMERIVEFAPAGTGRR